jgi:tetratricopeptide (TPR) repeat protein
LVGPFTISGAPRYYLDQELGNIVTYGVVSWLSANQQLAVVPLILDQKNFKSRQLVDLADLLQAPILYDEKPDIGKDREGFRRITSIANALKARGCDFLFGGSISFEGSVISISTYILNTEKTTLSRGAGPLYYNHSTPSAQLSAWLAERLLDELKPALLAPLKLEIGCLRVSGGSATALDGAKAILAQKMAKQIHDSLIETLEQTPGTQDQASPSKAICETPEAEFSDTKAFALLTGDISFGAPEPTFTPRIRVNVHDPENGSRSVPISLAPTNFDPGKYRRVAKNYVEQVRLLLEALNGAETTLADLTDVHFQINDTGLLSRFLNITTENASESAETEHSLVLGYKSLSRESSNPLSFAILGAGFLQKGKFELAETNLSRAVQLLESTNQAESPWFSKGEHSESERKLIDAHCLELLAVAQSSIGYFQAADRSVRTSIDLFRQIHDPRSVGRVRRVAAQISLKNHDIESAIRGLEADESLSSDYKSLTFLGSLEASQGKLEEASKNLNLALRLLDGNDGPARLALGDAFEAIGDQWLNQKSNADARSSFENALQAREAQSTRYKLAFAAMKAGDLVSAENGFRDVTQGRQEDSGRWAEAAWLELLEVELLKGKFSGVITQSDIASVALRGPAHDDARFVVEYLRLLARSLIAEPVTSSEILSHELEHLQSRQFGSAANLNWNSDKIDNLIEEPQKFLDSTHPYTVEHLDIIRQAQSAVRQSR